MENSDEEFLQVIVFDSSSPNAGIAWQGTIKNADYIPQTQDA